MSTFFYRTYQKPDATTDRGWVFINHNHRPDRADNAEWRYFEGEHQEGSACGNYIDYEHGEHHQEGEPTVHAVAYLLAPCPTGQSSHHIGAKWCKTPQEAILWIEQTILDYCWRVWGINARAVLSV